MRNPEYNFIDTDAGAVVSAMIAAYERITGVTVRPASPENLFIRWVADIIIQERVLCNWTGNQNLPSRAAGENLDALGQLFYDGERPEAKPAVCAVRFHISAAQETSVLIPQGTRVTDLNGGLVWETAEDVYVPIGELYADAAVRCMTPGVVGNGYAAGQINTLTDLSAVAFYSHCENITASEMGSDRADDDEYYRIMRESNDAYSTAGAKGSYVYHAKSVSTEIADVVANSPGPGHVRLYVLMKGGAIAGEEMKKGVYDACSPDHVRPLTDFVAVNDPEVLPYDIDLTFYIPSISSVSSAEIEDAAREAVDEYIAWQCGKLGRDINPDELRQRVKAAGIKRVELREPVFTVLRDGTEEGGPAPQVAIAQNVNIVNGGYEDE